MFFRTPNLPLAAFLKARGVPLERYERDRKTVFFVFGDRPRCLTLREEYMLGSPPEKAFMLAFDDLRDMIHAG